MEVRSEGAGVGQLRSDKLSLQGVHVGGIQRTRLQLWIITICSGILIWTSLVQLFAVGKLWHWHPHLLSDWSSLFTGNGVLSLHADEAVSTAPRILPPGIILAMVSLKFLAMVA